MDELKKTEENTGSELTPQQYFEEIKDRKHHITDTFNKETGLAMCIVRKLTGNRNYNKVFEKYCK